MRYHFEAKAVEKLMCNGLQFGGSAMNLEVREKDA